jgi:macrolide transport system ATP-binding/permease protein
VTVSRDRVFLERVATSLLEVDANRRRVVRYGNGYPGYLAEKAAARQRWAQAHDQWRSDIDRLREAAATVARQVGPGRSIKDGNKMAYDQAGGRVQQSLASRVRNAEERLRRLLADPVPPPPEPLRFTPALRARRLQGVVLDAADVAVTDRLDRTSLTVTMGEHLLITGPNGAGKSILLRVLAGRLAPERGRVTRSGRIGYPAQDPQRGEPDETVLAAFARGRAGAGRRVRRTAVVPRACSAATSSRYRSADCPPGSCSVSLWRGCSASRRMCCCSTNQPTSCRPPSSSS